MTVLYTLVYQGVKNPILIVLLHLTALTKVLAFNARFSYSLFGVCPITSLILFFFFKCSKSSVPVLKGLHCAPLSLFFG